MDRELLKTFPRCRDDGVRTYAHKNSSPDRNAKKSQEADQIYCFQVASIILLPLLSKTPNKHKTKPKMLLYLKRNYSLAATAGLLTFEEKPICFILEDAPDRNGVKDAGIECIAEGTYSVLPAGDEARWTKKVREFLAAKHPEYSKLKNFIGIPRLQNVPLFTGIDIHPGNKVEDTLGCLLPAYNMAIGWTDAGKTVTTSGSISAFVDLYNQIQPALAAGKLQIKITGK